jgi:multidrug efflux pump subunit AcrA (membrane-fusion protein)
MIGAVAASLALTLLISGCSLLPREDEPLAPPLSEPVQVRLQTAEVKRNDIRKTVAGTAVFEPVSLVNHQFEHSGFRLEKMAVAAGAAVKRGDLLMTLTIPNLEKDLLQRQIEVERKKLQLEQARQGTDERVVRIAKLDLELAEMELATVQEKWTAREVKAEIDGIITFLDRVSPGDWIEPYQTLAIVAEPAVLQLSMSVASSDQASPVELGMVVQVDYKDRKYEGKVVQTPRSAPYTDNQLLRDKYNRTLLIELPNLPKDAAIGQSAHIEIVIEERLQALTLPKSGVRKYFGRVYVQVLEEGKRRELDVETGIETSTEYEIVKGLEEGQIVIIQ